MEVAALLGVGEVIRPEDFQFPVFLDKMDDGDTVRFEHRTVMRSAQGRPLCRGYVLRHKYVENLYLETNLEDDFSWCFNNVVEDELWWYFQPRELKHGSSMLNTHLKLNQPRNLRSKGREVFLPRLIAHAWRLGEWLIDEVLREGRCDVIEIASAVGFEQPINDLELGSGSVHFGCLVFAREVVVSEGLRGGVGKLFQESLNSNPSCEQARSPAH